MILTASAANIRDAPAHPPINEPRHEETCFSHMRTTKVQIRLRITTKVQISLRIHAVWSAPLLFTT